MARVLIIDDSRFICELVRRWLESIKIEVFSAFFDKGQVMPAAKDDRDRVIVEAMFNSKPDIVILDLDMSGFDGEEVGQLICKYAPDVRIVIYSGKDKERMIAAKSKLNAHSYVFKTQGPGGLIMNVEEIVRAKEPWRQYA